jgi:hypothetical protein
LCPICAQSWPSTSALSCSRSSLAAAHRIGVDAQREGRVGVPELHHVGRVLADRHENRGGRVR